VSAFFVLPSCAAEELSRESEPVRIPIRVSMDSASRSVARDIYSGIFCEYGVIACRSLPGNASNTKKRQDTAINTRISFFKKTLHVVNYTLRINRHRYGCRKEVQIRQPSALFEADGT
jgi:hypothetical protein